MTPELSIDTVAKHALRFATSLIVINSVLFFIWPFTEETTFVGYTVCFLAGAYGIVMSAILLSLINEVLE